MTPQLDVLPNQFLTVTGLRRLVQGNCSMAVFIFRLKDFTLCRELYGEEIACGIDTHMQEILEQVGNRDRSGQALRLGPGETMFLRTLCPSTDLHLMDQAFSLKMLLHSELRKHTLSALGREFEIEVGFAVQTGGKAPEIEKTFHETVNDARRMAIGGIDIETMKLTSVFRTILKNQQIDSLFQPIYNFETGQVTAWEALSRGPQDSVFHAPSMLFEFAEQYGQLFLLEQVCRSKAIATVGTLEKGQKLFLNIHPRTVVDPSFSPGRTMALLQDNGLSPENIVFEITERHAIKDFSLFHKTLDHYRSQGFSIAVDDAGTGYSGLSSIAALQPEYIKVDMSLVRDVDRDPVRRALMETMVTLAGRIGSEIIAEGIETREEASTLVDMGVHHGQGYFLSRPHFPKPETRLNLREIAPFRHDNTIRLACSIPIGQLVHSAVAVSPDTPVQSVQRIFSDTPDLSGIVVTEDDKPTGLVMAYSLDRSLASLYGRALYSDKPISVIMDPTPMIVDEREAVEAVAKQANAREMFKVYDEIVVTRNSRLLGMVTVRQMLTTLAQVQVEMAKGTNPLTGLPGNVALEKEIDDRLQRGRPFSMLYADLDHFKVFNDVYGFRDGDKVILLLGRIMTWAIARHGEAGDFLGHIGGDDFVAVAEPAGAERICQAIVRCFKRIIPRYYQEKDRRRGWIQGKGRDGREQQFPLVSVSIGIVDCSGKCSQQVLGEKAAQIKSYAKSKPGNVYVRDRRSSMLQSMRAVQADAPAVAS